VAGLGAVLGAIFIGIWVYFRSRGGYRVVPIASTAKVTASAHKTAVGV
jgi:hypothetical protein